MPLVLSDASTLIHLAAIGRLALLRDLYQEITIPSAVWQEVVEEDRGRAGTAEVEAARQAGWETTRARSWAVTAVAEA
jgi:predicted nucleic acid-binding protein